MHFSALCSVQKAPLINDSSALIVMLDHAPSLDPIDVLIVR